MKVSKLMAALLAGMLLFSGCSKSDDQKPAEDVKPAQKDQTDSKKDQADSKDDQTEKELDQKKPEDKKPKPDEADSNTPADQKTEKPSEKPQTESPEPAAPAGMNSIRLEVPQKIQETGYYCGVACLQMVLDYHGISKEQSELAKGLKTDPVTGTEYEDLAREASIYIFGKAPQSAADPGYRAVLWDRNQAGEAERALFEERVKTDLESKDPVFVSINIAPAYGYDFDGVHELVLYGADYDENGNAQSYYCIDPSYNHQDPQYGGKKVWSADELWSFMNDNPEPGYVY